ncbi:uncharacterized protein BDZ99DRAFT_567310 [Mytilinidion resinicola]|uniref:HRDC domain-containing protein n=1 Tax=Mytilinidion resinicola TaxID=574789 RepID=A0A6A6Z5F3_9PEZI|nr:uncharacterized protein BDZ99DRAFT_567310 [Mytilinidion resinicola]KAF2815477.1 hypothetical protein BDZ99DRAFT_567310 [Mytilinidion resinicola]
MDPQSDFQTTQDAISAALVATTRASTRIAAEDLEFQRSLDPKNARVLDKQNARLLGLAGRLLKGSAGGAEGVSSLLSDNVDDLKEGEGAGWRGVVDRIDSLLERADSRLDEFTGAVKKGVEETVVPSKQKTAKTAKAFFSQTKNLPKSQLLFEHVPRNDETGGFRPLMTQKPHAKLSLKESLKEFTDGRGNKQFPHPYQSEIESYTYPSSLYERAEPIMYHPFESTTATLVDTPETLASMLAELKTAKEIAIDLEHHDNRSYIGIVSLMQISTRDKDWIVDTLVPWRRKLECLNEVFADPGILKVLHGAFMDIIWLQRDLGLYVVGLFDTHHAARALGYTGGSLAFLLLKFINFSANKQYQMADWRVRPLPAELFDYARSDTHYLLYIFDNMRNELIEKSNFSDPEFDLIARVLEKSRETALQRYEHPIYDEKTGQGSSGWHKILRNTPANFSKEQFAVFKAAHKWRDDVARQEDESVHFVLANHALLSVARAMPTEQAALLGSASPISPILRMRAEELVARIIDAKMNAEDGPDMATVLTELEEKHQAKRLAYLQAEVQSQSQTQPQSAPTPAVKSAQPTPAPTMPTSGKLRTSFSQFWGPAVGSTFWDQRRSFSTGEIRLALPLPPLSAEIFADAKDVDSPQAKIDPGARAEHPFVSKKDRKAQEDVDDVFVVKQLGGGRKRKNRELEEPMTEALSPAIGEAGEELNGQDDEVVLDDPAILDEKARKKAEKKALRKAEKVAKKAAQKAAANGGADAMHVDDPPVGEDGEVKAFDYAAQPSVIKGPSKEERKKNRKEKKKEKAVNPFAKANDAPRGMGRTQRETVGRSKTFKG